MILLLILSHRRVTVTEVTPSVIGNTQTFTVHVYLDSILKLTILDCRSIFHNAVSIICQYLEVRQLGFHSGFLYQSHGKADWLRHALPCLRSAQLIQNGADV